MPAARSGGGGVKGFLVTAVTLVLLAAGILGWARVNNISTVEGVYGYFKAWSDKFWRCGWGNVEWNCERGMDPGSGSQGGTKGGSTGGGEQPGGTQGGSSGELPPALGSGGVLPLDSPKEEFLQLLEAVPVAEASGVAYSRAEWKHWSGAPCNTRKLILERDGEGVILDRGAPFCPVVAGKWTSPYDKKVLENQSLVDIDHIVPLNYAAQHGGQAWDAARKEAFANDPSNLLAASASSNRGKGDKGPSAYMPDRAFHCTYSKLWTSAVTKYGLTVSEKDKFVLKDGLQKC